jgi:hypothetical protein
MKLRIYAASAALLALCACSTTPTELSSAYGLHCSRQHLTRLVFGTASPQGVVSQAQWNAFLAAVVTPRFPDGLTVIDAHGQWRGASGAIEREDSRVLEIAHAPGAVHIQNFVSIVDTYKKWFAQESVMVTQLEAQICL